MSYILNRGHSKLKYLCMEFFRYCFSQEHEENKK